MTFEFFSFVRKIFGVGVGLTAAALGAAQGFDTGWGPPGRETHSAALPGSDASRLWVRLRGIAEPAKAKSERAALQAIRNRNQRICVWIGVPAAGWKQGVRTTPACRLPHDLRDAFDWAKSLGATYGDLIDRWEVENEPDLGSGAENPEVYGAFLKVVSLGLRAGGECNAARNMLPVFGKQWFLGNASRSTDRVEMPASALVAPLGLPPGPYFERWMANQVLSYSSGFNFHYYGYAEDFSGVYRQFQDAVERPTAGETTGGPSQSAKSRDGTPASGGPTRRRERLAVGVSDEELRRTTLPVFVTEYGYGTLSAPAATTTEGRVRQWSWFKSVSEQTRALRIEGPMAFYLPPYLEHGTQEFGLTMKSTGAPPSPVNSPPSTWTAGGVQFHPADFGAARAEPWMEGIGRKIGENQASPALAWLLAQPAVPQPSLSWTANVLPASPVVIDFVAGAGAVAVKTLQGYVLAATEGDKSGGNGHLRIYNFSNRRISGGLDVGFAVERAGGPVIELTLAPGEMREVPVALANSEREFRPTEWTVRFKASMDQVAPSVFSTLLYPDGSRMTRRVVCTLDQAEPGTAKAKILDARPLTKEEPTKLLVGRWRVTPGVSVSEHQGVWTFSITKYPDQPLHPAIAELVVPDGFVLPEHSLFELEYRLAERVEADLSRVQEPRVPLAGSAVGRETMALCWRTENGNLFTVGPIAPATPLWQRYAQAKASFTMDFYGRANLPWRFAENRPLALVLKFYPNYLPATFEVRKTAVTTYGR